MNLIVCVKQVPDRTCRIEVSSPPDGIRQAELVYVVNPVDLQALDEALRIKERRVGVKVTVITLGPARADQALRRCLAAGADLAIHICDDSFEGSDTYVTAAVMARAIKRLEYDLILCGQQTTDGSTAQVGPRLAEVLGIPQVTAVAKIDVLSQTTLRLQRKIERGDREIIECRLPALLTVDTAASQARYPTYPLRKRAARAEVQLLDRASLGLEVDAVGREGSLVHVLSIASSRPKPKKTLVIEKGLSAEQRIKLLASGGVSDRKGDFLDGPPEDVAASVVQRLREEKAI